MKEIEVVCFHEEKLALITGCGYLETLQSNLMSINHSKFKKVREWEKKMHACGPILEFNNITLAAPPHATILICFETDQTAPQTFL